MSLSRTALSLARPVPAHHNPPGEITLSLVLVSLRRHTVNKGPRCSVEVETYALSNYKVWDATSEVTANANSMVRSQSEPRASRDRVGLVAVDRTSHRATRCDGAITAARGMGVIVR